MKIEIDIPKKMNEEIKEITNDEYYLFDSYNEFVEGAMRDKLLNIRSLKLQRKKVQLLESRQG